MWVFIPSCMLIPSSSTDLPCRNARDSAGNRRATSLVRIFFSLLNVSIHSVMLTSAIVCHTIAPLQKQPETFLLCTVDPMTYTP